MRIQFYHRIRQFLTLFIGVTLLFACNEEISDIDPIDDQFAFTATSDLALSIKNISLLDGSSDNILDNSSCHQIVLPIMVEFNDQELIINNNEDLAQLVAQYNQNPYVGLPIVGDYPITVRSSEYSLIDVNDQTALETLAAGCDNSEDTDIECIDFEYPIKVATYDGLNQLAEVSTSNSDEELFHLLENLGQDHILALQFPINILDANAESQVINDNFQFQNLLDSDADACDELDITYEDPVELPVLQTLSLQLTDAPFPFELIAEVNINVTRVEVKTAEENDSIPFVTIYDSAATFNMLDLTNGNTVNLGAAELPIGSYQFFRMFVDDGNVVMQNGEIFELNVPSGSQSGIKIIPEQDILVEEGVDLRFLLDFDVSKSLVVRGNPNSPQGINGFNFKPVVRATNLANSGSITGTVTEMVTSDPLANATVSILAADTLYTTSVTNEEGIYRIIGISAGTYDVQIELEEYLIATQNGITINENMETTVDFELNPQ